jgi:hypothetical protein
VNTFLTGMPQRFEVAKHNAENYLQLSQRQRAMEDVMPQAKKAVLEPPYPSLPEAIIQLVESAGLTVTQEQAARFIQKSSVRPSPFLEVENKLPQPSRRTARRLTGDRGKIGLLQILEVFQKMEANGGDYTQAYKEVADNRGHKASTSVNDKCTRYLGLKADEFRKLTKNSQQLYDKLAQKWPEYRAEIRAALNLNWSCFHRRIFNRAVRASNRVAVSCASRPQSKCNPAFPER